MTSASFVTLLSISLLVAAGCARVDPKPEFERAQALIGASTGVDARYEVGGALQSGAELQAVLDGGLSLDEALRLALTNNRKLQAEFMGVGVAKADLVQAGLLSNPSLSLLFLLPSGGGGQANLQGSIAQSISDLWQLPGRKAVAGHALEESVLKLSRFAGELVLDTKDAYYESVAAKESLAVARDNLAIANESLASVRAQVEAGVANQVDLNLAQGQALAAELGVRRSERDVAGGKRRLATLLSLEGDIADVELTDSLPAAAQELPGIELLVERARETRLDLKAAASAVRAAEAETSLARRGAFPELSVGPAVERPEDEGADPLVGAGATLTLPVFDQNQARVAKARYGAMRERKVYEELAINVSQGVRSAADKAAASVRTAAFMETQLLPQAEQSVDLARRSYELGDTTLLSLLETQRAALQARQGYIEARLDAAKMLSDLERAAGSPLDVLLRAP